jgi:exopolysaccharide biosynthesis polyprenyl glycosylphosphotransferase
VTSLTHLAAPFAPGRLVDHNQSELVQAAGRARSWAPSTARAVRHVPWSLLLGDVFASTTGVGLAWLAGIPLSLSSLVLLPMLWLALLAATRAYETRAVGVGLAESCRRVLRAGAGLALTCVALAALTDLAAGPGQLLVVSGAVAVASLAPRTARDVVITRTRAGARARTRVVVAGGHPRDVERVLAELRRTSHHALDVAAVCLARQPRRTTFDVPVAVGLEHLADTAAAAGAQGVILLPCDHLEDKVLRRIEWQLEHASVNLFVGTPLLDVSPTRATVAQAGGLGLLRVRPAGRRGPAQLVKDLLERPMAALMLLLLSPLLIGLSVAIRRDSPGPAIFRQSRVGRDGRAFTMYKFRTMSDGAHSAVEDLSEQNESDAVLFKMRQDPRITRLGAVLRKFSLDEVPQLFNVVLGHMSLVGPRPALQSEVIQYCQDARRRLVVKPGLTGLWQVSGRSDLSWEDTVRLDVKYVDNWSLALDLAILLRTVQAVVTHRGAY